MAALRSIGDALFLGPDASGSALLDPTTWQMLTSLIGDDASKACLGTAMAALGLSTSVAVFKGVGIRPVLLGMAGAGIVAAIGFTGAVLVS